MSQVQVNPFSGGVGGGNLPAGVIVMWSGTAAAVPNGWALCDGSNGTPDLRGRFVVGAGGSYNVGDTGGTESVTLTVSQIPEHSHTIPTYDDGNVRTNTKILGYGSGSAVSQKSTTNGTGQGQSHENRPPYYALCYIMKL